MIEVTELARRGALAGTSLLMSMVVMMVVVMKVLANDHDHDNNSETKGPRPAETSRIC